MNVKIVDVLPKNSWFRRWVDVWPLAEAPTSYILFSGMAMLGAVLGRKVWFQGDPHVTYPLMNLLLIGSSGIGKSTCLRDMALDYLVRPLPDPLRPMIITGKSTKEALHDDLMFKPHAIILASELANFVSKEKYQEGMVPYITDLVDLAAVRVRTKGGGEKILERPECCILGGSTKEWLQDMLPTASSEGGFLPRFLIIKEDYKRQRVADPRGAMTVHQKRTLDKERATVCAQFGYLCEGMPGAIGFEDYDASDAYSIWYQTYFPPTGNLSPFAARAGAHVLRLALLCAVSCDRNTILADDVHAGIALFDYSMNKLQEVIVPMTMQGKMLNKLLEMIGTEELSQPALRRAMRNYCASKDVDAMLGSLLSSGDIILDDGKYRRKGRYV